MHPPTEDKVGLLWFDFNHGFFPTFDTGRGGAPYPTLPTRAAWRSASLDSCQLLAQISHPDTPAKQGGKACLERGCEGMQG